jgi:hypothetical protein
MQDRSAQPCDVVMGRMLETGKLDRGAPVMPRVVLLLASAEW